MLLISHNDLLRLLSDTNSVLHDRDYRKPVSRGLLETMLQADGYLAPDLVPVAHAFLVSIRRGCEEVGSFFLNEAALNDLIGNLAECGVESERYETEIYCAEQRRAFISTTNGRRGSTT
ncbi:hypothetical protein [Paraburkholderia sp. BCC1876]|uniref:hypothetical protein n=1 Tax=Paraburkholderia sp. BCC1876 TaxID=2676303 RepID=UPI0015912C51|nr:hypothetical protein [Paraburkholderia sp. BCC1876]